MSRLLRECKQFSPSDSHSPVSSSSPFFSTFGEKTIGAKNRQIVWYAVVLLLLEGLSHKSYLSPTEPYTIVAVTTNGA